MIYIFAQGIIIHTEDIIQCTALNNIVFWEQCSIHTKYT